MAPDDNGDDDRDREVTRRSGYAEAIALLRERQRETIKRMNAYDERLRTLEAKEEERFKKLEDKQTALDALLNKGFGAIALITGVGVFLGWLISIGGNVFRFFK